MLALAAFHADLQQFPHTYYFHSEDQRFEFSAMLPRLPGLATVASESTSAALRFQSDLLKQALGDLAQTLAVRVGGDAHDVSDVVCRYARDHGWDPDAMLAHGLPT